MNHLRPIKQLPTHEVENMPPYIGNQDLWKNDKNLREAVNRERRVTGRTYGTNLYV